MDWAVQRVWLKASLEETRVALSRHCMLFRARGQSGKMTLREKCDVTESFKHRFNKNYIKNLF